MRVLFITNCPAPYRVKFFNELSRYCDLTVAFEMQNARNRDAEWTSEEQYQFCPIFLKSLYQKQEGAFCPEIKTYIQEFKKDVIVVGGYSTPTGMYSIIYMKMHQIPFVLNSDGGIIKSDSLIKASVKRFFIGSASAWLSTGNRCAKYLVHYGACESQIYTYPFTSIRQCDIKNVGVEQKKQLRRQLGISEKKVILYVGQFIERKGLDVLLKVCWNMTDTALVLVGGTDVSAFLPKTDSKQKVHIYVEGFKTETKVREYYQMADVFVLPTREDIWGMVVNEAMCYGLPVITTDHCNAGLELIQDGISGFVVGVNDESQLKDRMQCTLDNGELRHEVSKNALKVIENYTIEEMAKRHIAIFKQMRIHRES